MDRQMTMEEHQEMMRRKAEEESHLPAVKIGVDYSQPGSGFDDDMQDAPLDDPALIREIEEIEAKQHDQKIPAQHAEAAQAAKEANLEAVRKFKFDRQQEVTDYVPGRMMHMRDFMKLLLTINPTFFYNDFAAHGYRGLGYVKNGIAQFLTSVQDGQMIEWSQLRVDEHTIGTNEKYRGWRSVLMTLIDKEVLTEEEVHRVFGKPVGPRAKRWFRRLWVIRNGHCADCEQKLCICREIGEGTRADNYARPA